MAEWTNLFDLGECTVEVIRDPGGEDALLHSQVMAKGDSATFSDGRGNPADFTVAVSADGEVSLSAEGEGTSYNNNLFLVFVAPTYDHDYAARIRGAEFSGATSEAFGFINTVPDVDTTLKYATLNPASPEPLDMSELTGQRGGVGVYASPSF